MVTSTVNGEPGHPFAVGVTVYSTTPCTVPVFLRMSLMVVPQPEEHEPLPNTAPVITDDAHV